MRNRYLLLGMPILALALAACSWQRVTPPTGLNGAASSVDYQDKHRGRYKVIYEFPGGAGGQDPSGLTFVNGVMFGTTLWGGGVSGCYECGNVLAGTKVIYSFKGIARKDGAHPGGTLLPVGNELYGETEFGGSGSRACSGIEGCGTVYEVDASGNERVVYRFKGGSDGIEPVGGLVSLNGILYGVTYFGGVRKNCYFGSYSNWPPGCGVVFAIDSSGREKVIYRFKGVSDGKGPSKLVPFQGKLYGTTYFGGGRRSGCSYIPLGCGTVFRVTTSGKKSVIYTFKGGDDGFYPGALVSLNGSLWGTTADGGCGKSCQPGNSGIIFKMSTSGHERIVHRFIGAPDGANPLGPLAVVGNTIYGTTWGGGTGRLAGGTIFSATSKGVQILHSFEAYTGGSPVGLEGLTFDDSTKALYGETCCGGSHRAGTIFRYSP